MFPSGFNSGHLSQVHYSRKFKHTLFPSGEVLLIHERQLRLTTLHFCQTEAKDNGGTEIVLSMIKVCCARPVKKPFF